MAEIKIPAVEETIEVDRIIGNLEGPEDGPLVIFFGGIHGNEPSGVYALQEVLQEIERDKLELHGSVLAISGNLWALEHSQRYETTDLNRLWTRDRVENLRLNGIKYATEDERQQQQLFELIDTVLEGDKGPLYFFDLHTTSAHTAPFITVNDSLLNRRFTKQYPVPLILGIEEYLEGPLLSYINELGYVSFGFEGGQHDSLEAIKNHKVFIYLSLVFAGVLDKSQVPFSDYMHYLQSINPLPGSFYEIYDRHEIQKEERFEMLPG
ncbi:MAG TPA: aspartoacylase, partial [Cytophagales bacterium]|nr:aspartoacylase [Cytophagales bacterium]